MKVVLLRIARAVGRSGATFVRLLLRSLGAMDGPQRVSTLCTLAVAVTLTLPWYTKVSTGLTLRSVEQGKAALFVPSFVEASIVIVVIAVFALLIARGLRLEFNLPVRDGRLIAAAGVWTTVLIFYRFVDQPGGDRTAGLIIEYQLSWGIFFGLLAALALAGSGVWMLQAERERERVSADDNETAAAVDVAAPEPEAEVESG